MPDETAVIRAEGLTKRFIGPDGKPLEALSSVSLAIPSGRIVTLVGADAAGKTTFLRLAAGLMRPDGGTLTVLGTDIAKDAQSVQDRISYMPQKFGLYEDLSVQENLDLYADLHGVPQAVRDARYRELLAMSDLTRFTERPAGKLSGGMKQKLGLICTLVRTPELLLLDEPSVGVDPLSRRDLWKIVEKLVEKERISVLWATSYMDEAAKSSLAVALHEGRLLAAGVPSNLIAQAEGTAFRAKPAPGEPARALQAKLYDRPDLVLDAVPEGGDVRFILKKDIPVSKVESEFPANPVEPREPDFEDAFMTLILGEGGAREGAADFLPVAAESPAEDAKPVIRVRDLVRRFGDFTAVASTSFDVERGEIFGLLGPNGAGKTTTFRMLCGLLPATSGELEVAGCNLRFARAEARGRVGYVAQKFSLYGMLTVGENLRFFGGAYGLWGPKLKKRVAEVEREFSLEHEAETGMLPMGYKRRLAMAAALIHEPEILFLDEPTSGIDPIARRGFWRTITALAASGVTVIVTTHFMEEAEYCDQIAIQDAGKFLAFGTPAEVRREGGEGCRDMNSAFIAIVEKGRAAAKEGKA